MAGTEPQPVEAAEVATAPVLLGGNELTTNSLSEYFGASLKRIRNGQSGMLPVVVGLVIIFIIFQTQNGRFDSSLNLTNLIKQGSFIVVFGVAEIFVLLLGEIDLSIGYNAGVGAIITAELAAPPHNVNWFFAALAGVGVCTVIGTVIGLLVTRLGLPSFIVTLAFYLGLQGVQLYLVNHDTHASGGSIDITNNVLNKIINGNLTPTVGWILTGASVVVFGVVSLLRDVRRRQSGLVSPPLALTLLKVAGMAVAGLVLILICNHDRGNFLPLKGMPWVVPIVGVLLTIYTFMLNRTRFGRYLFAIGGNAEAARRAGISLNRIRLLAFVLAGFTAGVGGVILASFLGSVSGGGSDGGTYVLYAVAAAVIGGTSLLGGRGKIVHALLGGLVIAAIANGMSLISLGADAQFMVNGVVLLAAVTVDALARRRAVAT